MPFTFCHPAIVLPFSYLGKRVSMIGLITGSMIPDFEYFIRMKVRSEYGHTWSGLFWFDLPLGLLMVFIYQLVVKDKLIDNLPVTLNRRFSMYKTTAKRDSPQYLVVVALCILVGGASHILWDGFTHPTGRFVLLIPALSDTVQLFDHHIFIYKILQHASSLIGAIVIIASVYYLPLSALTKRNDIVIYWGKVLAVVFVTLFIKFLFSYHSFGEVIVTAIAGLFLGLIAASLMGRKHTTDANRINDPTLK